MNLPEKISNDKILLSDIFHEAAKLSGLGEQLNNLQEQALTSEKLQADMAKLANDNERSAMEELLTHGNNLAAIFSKLSINAEGQAPTLTDGEHEQLKEAINYFTDVKFRDTRSTLDNLLNKADLRTLKDDNPTLFALSEMSRSLSTFNSNISFIAVNKALDASDIAVAGFKDAVDKAAQEREKMYDYSDEIDNSVPAAHDLIIAKYDELVEESQNVVDESELNAQSKKIEELKKELKSTRDSIDVIESYISGSTHELIQSLANHNKLTADFDDAKSPFYLPKEHTELSAEVDAAKAEINGIKEKQEQSLRERKATEKELSEQNQAVEALKNVQANMLDKFAKEHVAPAEKALKEATAEAKQLSKEASEIESQMRRERGKGNDFEYELGRLPKFIKQMENDPEYVTVVLTDDSNSRHKLFSENISKLSEFAVQLGMDDDTRKDFFKQGWDRDGMREFAEKMGPWIDRQISLAPERAKRTEQSVAKLEESLKKKQAEVNAANERQKQAERELQEAKQSYADTEKKHAGNAKLMSLNQKISELTAKIEAKKAENEALKTDIKRKTELLNGKQKKLDSMNSLRMDTINKYLSGNGMSRLENAPSEEKARELMEQIRVRKEKRIKEKLSSPIFTEEVRKNPKACIANLQVKESKLLDEIQLEDSKLDNMKEKSLEPGKAREYIGKFTTFVTKYNSFCDATDRLADAVHNAKSLSAGASEAYMKAGDGYLIDQLRDISEHLEDKRRFMHSDSAEFSKMKKALNDLTVKPKPVADDEPFDIYEDEQLEEQRKAERLVKIEKLNKAAKAYITAKEAQTRNSPSEMRISRMNAAREIEKSTSMYLAQMKLLEEANVSDRARAAEYFDPNSYKKYQGGYLFDKREKVDEAILNAGLDERKKAVDVACAEARGAELDPETKAWANENRKLVDASHNIAQKRIAKEDRVEHEKGVEIVRNYLKSSKFSKAGAEWIMQNPGKAIKAFNAVQSEMIEANENNPNTYAPETIGSMSRYVDALSKLAVLPESERKKIGLPKNPAEDIAKKPEQAGKAKNQENASKAQETVHKAQGGYHI